MFADLHGRQVLVVGGGAVAQRKAGALLQAGAQVRVGAPAFTPELQAWGQAGRVTLLQGGFDPTWVAGAWLVVAATDERAVNAEVARIAGAQRLWVNVVDDPELSSFQVPSIVDRSPLVIAISSGGAAPVLARRLRERMESLLEHTLGRLAALAHAQRAAIRQRFPQMTQRRAFYDWLCDGPVAAHLRAGDDAAAQAALQAMLDSGQPEPPGRIVLVGAGPGPAAALTLGGLRALNEADVVCYGRGVSDEVRALARRDADQLATLLEGDALWRELADHAVGGRCVVLLRAGAGLALDRARVMALGLDGLQWEAVPGVS
ncbi:hypothetical protein GCM10025795_13360 [Verticiella sediminum]